MGVVHQYLRIVQLLHTHRELLLQGYYSYMWDTHRTGWWTSQVIQLLYVMTFVKLFLSFRMGLRRECREAMHSIAMITIRLQACLSVEHRIHTLWVHLHTFWAYYSESVMSQLGCWIAQMIVCILFSHISYILIFLRGQYSSENQGSADNGQKLQLVSGIRKKHRRSHLDLADGNGVGSGAFSLFWCCYFFIFEYIMENDFS